MENMDTTSESEEEEEFIKQNNNGDNNKSNNNTMVTRHRGVPDDLKLHQLDHPNNGHNQKIKQTDNEISAFVGGVTPRTMAAATILLAPRLKDRPTPGYDWIAQNQEIAASILSPKKRTSPRLSGNKSWENATSSYLGNDSNASLTKFSLNTNGSPTISPTTKLTNNGELSSIYAIGNNNKNKQ